MVEHSRVVGIFKQEGQRTNLEDASLFYFFRNRNISLG